MDKFQENLNQALRHLQIADHMAYVTFPLVNEKRLILKIFEEIYRSIIFAVDSMIEIEGLIKEEIEGDYIKNFFNRYGKDYDLTHEKMKKIYEIIELYKRHKESGMEFVKKDKIVILSDSLRIQALNINKVKEYLILAKEIITGINEKKKRKRFVVG